MDTGNVGQITGRSTVKHTVLGLNCVLNFDIS